MALNATGDATLVLYGEKDNFTQVQFDLFSDIAQEAWSKAETRWFELHNSPLTFESEASTPNNYRTQRARNLYRPTY